MPVKRLAKIAGTAAADILNGTSDADVILGNGGNDTLFGLGGDDTLTGGKGNDKLFGGAGKDTFLGLRNDGSDTYNGGSGIDTVDYSGVTGSEGVAALLANDPVIAPGLKNSFQAKGDKYVSIENITGTNFSDAIIGNDRNNIIKGGAGSDQLADGFGSDKVYGGDGDDVLYVSADLTADFFDGGNGRDFVAYATSFRGVEVNLETGKTGGDAAGDTFAGIEVLIGSNVADILTAAPGGLVIGGDGDDLVSGASNAAGLSVETLAGGNGNDQFQIHRNGLDVLLDFSSALGNQDKIAFKAAEFGGIASVSVVKNIAAGSPIEASIASAQFIFDLGSKNLYFDPDGIGFNASPEVVAMLPNYTGALFNLQFAIL
jgi:Ca2+-binding RTX toxin-like protein